MKTLTSTLAAHLASGATSMAYCWRVTRRDGVVLGFTEHDRDLAYGGTLFLAGSGLTASRLSQGLGLSVDNMEAQGALSSDAISEADILAGRYDDAVVELFWVNWADPSQGVTIAAGNLGEIKRQGLAFSAEVRSLANRLNQKIGQTYGRSCSATLGDQRCQVDIHAAAYTSTITVLTAGIAREILFTNPSPVDPDFFSAGLVTFSSGLNAGLSFEVKAHLRTAGADLLALWLPPPFPLAVGDAASATAGCRKTLSACRTKFSNTVNFRGFPFIPGSDAVTRYATDANAAEGGSGGTAGASGAAGSGAGDGN